MDELIELSKRHFSSVIEKRLDEITAFYVNSPELLVFVEGPRWATVSYQNVARGWRDFCDSAITVTNCEWVENLTSMISGAMGFVAGIVELQVQINDQVRVIRFRGSFIFERGTDQQWRVVHEHFSQPAADPYGIGDWLKQD